MHSLHNSNERGIALLLALFVIGLATILVFEFGRRARFDQSVSRGFVDSIQGDYVLKSGLNFGKLLLEIKDPTVKEDWFREPWAMVAQLQSLPIGVMGDPRMMIVDDSSKIDINWLPTEPPVSPTPGAARSEAEVWRDTLAVIFEREGFVNEQYDPKNIAPLGMLGLKRYNQVAAIIDDIDGDYKSYPSSVGFKGKGIESGVDKTIFHDNLLKNFSELLSIPGMTLERVGRIAPFVTVSPSQSTTGRLNINTVPVTIMKAMGFADDDAEKIDAQRMNAPIKQSDISTIVAFDPTLAPRFTSTSDEFSIYVRIKTATSTRWLHGTVKRNGRRRKWSKDRCRKCRILLSRVPFLTPLMR